MRNLKFLVNGRRLAKAERFGKITASDASFLNCEFEFSDEWSGMVKAAAFFDSDGFEHAVPILKNSCFVPHEVVGGRTWSFQVVGMSKGGSVVRTDRITINQAVI